MTTKEVSGQAPMMRPGSMALVLCDECACGMLTLEEAVAVARASSREIHRQVEAGAVHFKETSDGLLLVCLKTLVQGGARRSGIGPKSGRGNNL